MHFTSMIINSIWDIYVDMCIEEFSSVVVLTYLFLPESLCPGLPWPISLMRVCTGDGQDGQRGQRYR